MKIVIGVDDSPHSRAAMEYVKRATWPKGTRVVIATASKPLYALVDMGGASYLQEAQEFDVKHHEELAARMERELRDAGFETSAKVLFGDAREALIETVKLEGADLLVVGSHGRTGFDKLLMGSVASHVVTHAPCSVLVVKLPKK
jgi:nucleotide-binding universal stress UspA family protein